MKGGRNKLMHLRYIQEKMRNERKIRQFILLMYMTTQTEKYITVFFVGEFLSA